MMIIVVYNFKRKIHYFKKIIKKVLNKKVDKYYYSTIQFNHIILQYIIILFVYNATSSSIDNNLLTYLSIKRNIL